MLPHISSTEQYRALDKRAPAFATMAESILRDLRFPFCKIAYPSDGSSPVAIADAWVVKFFASLFADGFQMERASLRFLRSLESIAPVFKSDGMVDGWNYLVMSRLPGKTLKQLWPELSKQEKTRASFQVGEALRKMHDLPIGNGIFETSNWAAFLETQKSACLNRHEKLGLRPSLLKQIEPFLMSVQLTPTGPQCFLHTEVMRDHVFFEQSGGRLKFSGFIDFEPSMLGEREYDFASVGIFLASGDAESLRAFFEGYGNLKAADTEFRRRIMAYCLLHKYSNLKWYLEFMPDADSLEELADKWWNTSDH